MACQRNYHIWLWAARLYRVRATRVTRARRHHRVAFADGFTFAQIVWQSGLGNLYNLEGETADMDSTVRVMLHGREIDRIASAVRMEGGAAVVAYRNREWHVVDGCIHLDNDQSFNEVDRNEWVLLVTRLLPDSLPCQVGACSELIESRFRGAIPGGILGAICSLVALRLEQQARAALVDFLAERRDSARLRRLLTMQLLFMERTRAATESTIVAEPSVEQCFPQDSAEAEFDWEWESEAEPEVLVMDDYPLRKAAAQLQESIGNHRPEVSEESILGLCDVSDISWVEEGMHPDDQVQRDSQDQKIIERTLELGPMAIELLRYFTDNPGDRSFHAEQVLGYPALDINRLLTGSLSQHVTRGSTGGWECQCWVADVLGAIDGRST